MNINQFTIKSQEAIGKAQEIAQSHQSQTVENYHLLKGMILSDDYLVPNLMKKLGVSYSQYYNRRYKRQGHLFQDRYLSEAVEDESYLLTVFRYILNNPRNAGICPAADYAWSSYGLYAHPTKMMELALVRELIGDEEQYRRFVNAANEDACLEYETPKRGDDWAREKIAERLNAESGSTLQSLDRKGRDAALQQLLEEGLSIRQIERLTGISRGIIQKAKR
jgi:ATP-dependent Clp protease ATP-binding subunit ClpA